MAGFGLECHHKVSFWSALVGKSLPSICLIPEMLLWGGIWQLHCSRTGARESCSGESGVPFQVLHPELLLQRDHILTINHNQKWEFEGWTSFGHQATNFFADTEKRLWQMRWESERSVKKSENPNCLWVINRCSEGGAESHQCHWGRQRLSSFKFCIFRMKESILTDKFIIYNT